MICAPSAPSTHHLCVVGIEGLFIQGELLRAQRVVQLDHLRKLKETRGSGNSRAQGRPDTRTPFMAGKEGIPPSETGQFIFFF